MKKNNKIAFKLQIITVLSVTILLLGGCLKNAYALLQINTPQILIILDNSQSMDGDLSGAIMTGSGTVAADTSSSSPTNYTVPTGFTAPETGAAAGTSTEYTYTAANGTLIDNSASRLNVAKAAIMDAYNEWSGYAEFGLMDYGVQGSPSLYITWVYYMSESSGSDNILDHGKFPYLVRIHCLEAPFMLLNPVYREWWDSSNCIHQRVDCIFCKRRQPCLKLMSTYPVRIRHYSSELGDF